MIRYDCVQQYMSLTRVRTLPFSQKKLQQSQLDFLLSKASEYSAFISQDLEELQAAMTEKARQKLEKTEKRKKRKGGSDAKGPAKKKGKGNSGDALKTALVKDAVVRSTSKPIFTQPPNLSTDCFLKDYQLEGVRWLASLYENGVSGILADEVSVKEFCCNNLCDIDFVSHHLPLLLLKRWD